MTDWLTQWYGFLSSLTSSFTQTLGAWSYSSRFPLITALLLGFVGSTSPCQLTTNASALAYVSGGRNPRQTLQAALAYVLGKVTGYTIVGVVAVLLGLRLADASVPVVVIARKALGPLMLVSGLVLLGWLRFNFSAGQSLSTWLARQAQGRGTLGAYLLGVAFSSAFCPTLFWLFFGLLVPLTLSSSLGPLLPGVFAVGTAVPFLAFAALLGFGAAKVQSYLKGARALEGRVRILAGIIFIVAGINDTLVYWVI
ncbi:MAG: sulfite exporter TauE/SafE family protein [Chloroflexi bacterium]|nr:sulfite exporter TauE/SafE family protein [Chloroflexota bacterium]